MWTPSFQAWRGVNDRFAYGDVKSMQLYMTRGIRYKKQYDRVTKGSGEKFLRKYLRNNKISVYNSSVRLIRIRANGVVARKDCLDPIMKDEFGEKMERCLKWEQSAADPEEDVCKVRDISQC